ncbi:MAG: Flp pilus assembly complex ATPase component TadA [Coriobacteriia bacterium]|nr:Flp pilus assembly complex ATPase component TadA [Coriobacteriia bacterium]MBN2821575.1 Flp pilus assembly complex ATPase component TadA [Coriobacteriia bacterium]
MSVSGADTTDRRLILSVDDDEDIRSLVKLLLEPGGYEIVTAASAEEALSFIQTRQPDLILTDVMMPGMDGYEFCEKLQQLGMAEYTPVIFMSALGDEQDRARAIACGAVDYVVKPINRAELREKVDTHLNTRSQWDDLKDESDEFTEGIVPADFLSFRDAMAEEYASRPKRKERVEQMRPQDIYAIARSFGISSEDMAQRIAGSLDLEYLQVVDVASIAMGVLPVAFCKTNVVVPVMHKGRVTYVVSNPFNWELLDLLERKGEGHLFLAVSDPEGILSIFRQSAAEAEAARTETGGRVELREFAPDDVGGLTSGDIESRPIVYIANNLIMEAFNERASDIHLEPKEDHYDVRFRVDGDMRDMLVLKRRTGAMLISRYKAIGGMDIAERRRPQDGTLEANVGKRKLKLRLATSSGPYGESVVIRLLETSAEATLLTDLGMTEEQSTALYGYAGRSHGMIAVVGPTGSGKTTTVYSVLTSIDAERRSLMSVEDPVEYVIPRANQQQVNDKAKVTFENLLKSSVRQDPDILFMGEVRDAFSAKTAVDFASTGHLTISTLHTSTSTTAIFRLERLGVERSMMADAILCIVAQRLIKRLCPDCRRVARITAEERRMLEPFTDDIPTEVAHPVGCPNCYNGYRGREGVYEVLQFDPQLTEWVRSGIPVTDVRQRLRERGDYLMFDHAVDKVRDLTFSVQDVYDRVLIEEESEAPDSAAASAPPVASSAQRRPSPDADLIGALDSIEDSGDSDLIGVASEKRLHLLIADDDESTRDLIGKVLSDAGYAVSYVADGEAALARIGDSAFDLCLADLNMPSLDGLALLQALHESGDPTPVMLLTGTAGFDTEAAALRLGAADYVRKPIRKDVLLLRVERILQRTPRS